MTDPFSALADPTRRRVLELLATGERTAGELTSTITAEAGLSQPAVSQHLAVLRDAGLVTARADGPRRVYATAPAALHVVRAWLDAVTPDLGTHLDALATEVARGTRARRRAAGTSRAARGDTGDTGTKAG